MTTHTPNGKRISHAEEIANAYAAEEAKHPAFRAKMVRDAQDDNSGLGAAAWIIYGAASTVLAVWIVLLVLL